MCLPPQKSFCSLLRREPRRRSRKPRLSLRETILHQCFRVPVGVSVFLLEVGVTEFIRSRRDLDAWRFYSINSLTSTTAHFRIGRNSLRKGTGIDIGTASEGQLSPGSWHGQASSKSKQTRAELAKSGSWKQHLQRPAYFGREPLLMEIFCWVSSFLRLNWSRMNIFNEVSSPHCCSSYLLWRTHWPLGTGIPELHVLAIAYVLVERTRDKGSDSWGYDMTCSGKAEARRGLLLVR